MRREMTGTGRRSRGWILWLAPVLVVLAVWPLLYPKPFVIHVATLVLLAAIGAAGLHVVVRTGQLFMAQAAFAGLGAYTSVLLMMKLSWPYPLALAAAMAAPALLAACLGPIILKLRGVYFVLISYALGEVMLLIFSNSTLTGGSNGIYDIPPPAAALLDSRRYYYLVLVLAVAAVAFVYRVVQSDFGRHLDAIRVGEALAASTGVPVLQFKVTAFVIAAALAGMEGSLTAHYIRYISPISYSFDHSLTYVVINVVGGMGHLAGPLLGTLFVVPLPELLRGFREYQQILYGLVLMLTMALAPEGIMGLMRKAARAARAGRKGGAVAA